jgi:hypothetical protein
MSRPYTPGGRFDAEFETDEILSAISKDLTNPVGTNVLWYVWVAPTDTSIATAGRSVIDPVYDVGGDISSPYIPSTGTGGRRWRDPVEVPAIRAVIKQGSSQLSERGFYNADLLHVTMDRDELMRHIPDILDDPDPLNRDRIVWKGHVYKPFNSTEQGIVGERYTIISFECQQVMPEEMVNDPQFQAYAI